MAPMKTPDSGVTVRMYRPGFGDCFLLAFRKRDGDPFYMMIDCGVHAQWKGGSQRIRNGVGESKSQGMPSQLAGQLLELLPVGGARSGQPWVGGEQINQPGLGTDLLGPLFLFKEEVLQTWRLQVPVDHDGAEALQVEPLAQIGQSHGASHAAFIGIEGVDHGAAPCCR